MESINSRVKWLNSRVKSINSRVTQEIDEKRPQLSVKRGLFSGKHLNFDAKSKLSRKSTKSASNCTLDRCIALQALPYPEAVSARPLSASSSIGAPADTYFPQECRTFFSNSRVSLYCTDLSFLLPPPSINSVWKMGKKKEFLKKWAKAVYKLRICGYTYQVIKNIPREVEENEFVSIWSRHSN